MATGLVKAIILLACINIVLFTGGLRVIGDDNSNFVNQFINVNESVNGSVVVSDDFKDTMPDTLNQGGSTLLQFIDSLGAAQDIFFFIVNIIFTPLALFVSAGMPSELVIFFGIPLMIFLYLGLAYFLRSGS